MSLYDTKKFREERANVITETQDLARTIKEEERQATGEELERFETLESARADLEQKIKTSEVIERSEQLTVEVATPQNHTYRAETTPVVTRQDKEDALRAWMCTSGRQPNLMKDNWVDSA